MSEEKLETLERNFLFTDVYDYFPLLTNHEV